MSEAHLHRFQAERFANFGGECMPQPMRGPRADACLLRRSANRSAVGVTYRTFRRRCAGVALPIRAGAIAATISGDLAGLVLGRTSFASASRGEKQ